MSVSVGEHIPFKNCIKYEHNLKRLNLFLCKPSEFQILNIAIANLQLNTEYSAFGSIYALSAR